jgi:proline iminopeptidase
MFVEVNGTRLFFDIDGAKLVPDGPQMRQKPTLLLLHGGPGFDHSTFKPAFSALTEVAQLVYLDHRGQGRSARSTPDRWTLAQWGDDVRAFCEALGIERPVVLGHSFGGFVALSYAVRHPDHPGKLILSSTGARERQDRVLAAFERLGGAEAREAARRFLEAPGPETLGDYTSTCFPLYGRAPRDPHANDRTVWSFEVMFDFLGGEGQRFDLLPEIPKIRCPVLVLSGEDDPITPVADQVDIVAALRPGLARHERFPGCGHGVFRDEPERALAVIREFVASQD